MKNTKEIQELLKRIIAYVDAPHWTTDRKYKIRETAVKAKKLLEEDTRTT